MNKLTARLLLPAALLILAGCATPESRIKKHPELFEALPVDMQESVSKGQINVGFTEDAVFLALGKPDRTYTRQTEAGTTEIWSYVDFYTTSNRQLVDGRFRVRDSKGVTRTVYDSVWVDVNVRNEYEKLRVEMREGKVQAIERVRR